MGRASCIVFVKREHEGDYLLCSPVEPGAVGGGETATSSPGVAVAPTGHLFSRVLVVVGTAHGQALPLSAPAASTPPDTLDPTVLVEGSMSSQTPGVW